MQGIDYGLGVTNINPATGIRFGVIPANEVGQAWWDDAEMLYGDPRCPICGDEVPEDGATEKDYRCEQCEEEFHSYECFPDEVQLFHYQEHGYIANQSGDDTDIFIELSPYYTLAAFCSPCAPGACYLLNPCDDGAKAYCLGHDWFENGKAPYPVYSIETGELVQPEEQD